MLKQAIWIVKLEIKRNWMAFLLTAFMVLLLGLFTALLMNQYLHDEWINPFIFDLIFLAITPSFATLFMSGPYLTLQTIKNDPYTKLMGFYRSMAIPFKSLILSRTISMLVTLVTMSIVFYVTIYLALPTSFVTMLGEYWFMKFALIWFGYALVIGGLMPFIEYGTSGKLLYILTFAISIFLLVFIYLFRSIYEVELSLSLMSNNGWMAVILSILFGCIGCLLWHKLLAIRLSKRDYL